LLGHKRELDICADGKGPAAVFVNVNPINNKQRVCNINKKEKRLRFLTDIAKITFYIAKIS